MCSSCVFLSCFNIFPLVYFGWNRRKITSISTESSMSLAPSESPSFCSLKIKSGLLYGLRASRCVTLSLRGLSCTSPTLFLFDAQSRFFTLGMLTPLLMLLRKDWDECLGLVRLASAGAGGRTVTFLPARDKEMTHQKKRQNKAIISSKEIWWG